MVRALALLMLAAFACAATIGCGSPGPPVIPEDAPEYDGTKLDEKSNTAAETLKE